MLKKATFLSLVTATILSAAALPGLSGKIVRVDANGFDVEKVEAITGIHEGDNYSIAALQAAERNLQEALKQAGYVDATVNVRAVEKDDGVKVIFDVNKGDPIKVTKVTFVGNSVLDEDTLKKNLVNKEGGFFSWLTGGGIAIPSQLEADAARIRDEYLKRGYLDVVIDKPLMKTDFASKSAEVTYVIKKEGQPYTVSSLQIEPVPGVDMDKIKEEISLHEGEVFNVEKLRKDLSKLVEAAANQGYAFAQAQPQFRKNDATHTIDIIYRVNPGSKVKIHDVKIAGNTKTKDHVVRRYIYLAPGDTFNLTDLKDSKDELQRTGYFDAVSIVPKRVGGNEVDLDVKVKEAQTGSIMAGLSYGSYDGFGINASLSDRNVFGTGIGYSLSLEKTKKSYNYSISLTDPRVFDSLYSLSVGLYTQKYEFIDYTKKEKGAYLTVGRKLTRNISASIGYNYASVKYSDFDDPANPNYSNDYESYKKSALTASITFDNTDDYLTPRKGFYANLFLEYAGLGGDAKYLKTEFKGATYYGMENLIGYDLILRGKLRLGYINDKGKTPRAERLFLGGSSWGVRGYSPASIAPVEDVNDPYSARIGGFKSAVVSAEASIPIKFAPNMRLTGFVDYGIIKGNSQSIKRSSFGAQIEWRSPFGPLNLIFAKPINKKRGDRTSKFELTISSKY
jgi:outer membrane protein insertion porin family